MQVGFSGGSGRLSAEGFVMSEGFLMSETLADLASLLDTRLLGEWLLGPDRWP
ncbi:MAG: hypothetical protein RL227_1488 [Pseudomonadota bacterium]|jgi:hypothetical protein